MASAEIDRAAALWDAQLKADAWFAESERDQLIRPGIAETKLNEEVFALAERMYGVDAYWHKRIVRAGRGRRDIGMLGSSLFCPVTRHAESPLYKSVIA